jgi:hypothetical protein
MPARSFTTARRDPGEGGGSPPRRALATGDGHRDVDPAGAAEAAGTVGCLTVWRLSSRGPRAHACSTPSTRTSRRRRSRSERRGAALERVRRPTAAGGSVSPGERGQLVDRERATPA